MSVVSDGSSGNILERTTNLPPSRSVTMMGWFKVTSKTSFGTFLGWQTNGGNMIQFDNTPVEIGIWADGSLSTGTDINTGQWYHVAYTVEADVALDIVLYLDGIVDATQAGSNAGESQLSLLSDNIDEPLDGLCAAVKIWDIPLPIEHIQNEMWTYVPQRTANLIGWSPFLGESATTFKDYGPNLTDWTEGGTITRSKDNPPISWAKTRTHIFIPSAVVEAPVKEVLNFVGFETGGLEEVNVISGTPSVETGI